MSSLPPPVVPRSANRGTVLPAAGRVLAAFLVGLLVGAAFPAMRRLLRGSADPFASGWPPDLQASAFLTVLLAGGWLRHPWLAAIGLYAGLLTYLFLVLSPPAPYPVPACIALAIHGLLPALLGAVVVSLLRFRSRQRARRVAPVDRTVP